MTIIGFCELSNHIENIANTNVDGVVAFDEDDKDKFIE